MRVLETPQTGEPARFVSHGAGRQHFAPPRQQELRAPESVGDRIGPTPPADLFGPAAGEQTQGTASRALPPWASTSSAARAASAPPVIAPDGAAAAEIVVRIELVIVDQTQQVSLSTRIAQPDAAQPDAAQPDAIEPIPALAEPEARRARSSAPLRAAVRIVGLLALVGIGLFLVQLGAWLAR